MRLIVLFHRSFRSTANIYFSIGAAHAACKNGTERNRFQRNTREQCPRHFRTLGNHESLSGRVASHLHTPSVFNRISLCGQIRRCFRCKSTNPVRIYVHGIGSATKIKGQHFEIRNSKFAGLMHWTALAAARSCCCRMRRCLLSPRTPRRRYARSLVSTSLHM